MIISASRRTDIPAFYSKWFFNRIKEGFLLVPNPYNPKMISRISLDPEGVDCIVFWTKNARPMLDKLDGLKAYTYYFQYTVNPYGKEIEVHLPSLQKRMDTFKALSDKIGKEKVIWRYDPLFTNKKYTIDFHKEAFARMAEELHPYTDKCMLGFIDPYYHIRRAIGAFDMQPLMPNEIEEMARSFKTTVDKYPIMLNTCTLKIDLHLLGIPCGLCIDGALIERLVGCPIRAKKDKNQRDICNCVESIDIGTYESCLNGCVYCYAIQGNYLTAAGNHQRHDPDSPLMIGTWEEGTKIKDREIKSLKVRDLFSPNG